jgi:hypothetical protein
MAGFLDAINKGAGVTTGAAPEAKPNPFAKKPGTGTPSSNPFAKKIVAPPVEEVKEEAAKPEETKEVAAPAQEPVVETKTETAPPVEKVEEAAPVEEAPAEKAEEATTEESQEAPKEEKKKPPTRSRNRKAAEKKEEVAAPVVDEAEEFDYINEFNSAAQAIKDFGTDDVWDKFESDIRERMDALKISYDMDTAKVKKALSDLDGIRSDVWYNFQRTKAEYENLTNRQPEGLIERVKKTAFDPNVDKNENSRHKTGILACQQFPVKDTNQVVDLFALAEQYKLRYEFLKGVMDTLEFKRQCMITINSAVKQEGDLNK